MNEKRLRMLLRETPVPAEEVAERRGLLVVTKAFAERRPPRQQALPRLGLVFAIGLLFAALTLSPAGAKVRDWIDDVFTAGVPNAEHALTDIPGGGRLLVQASGGSWLVQPDGSRRLLGNFGEATWSPHGLFVAATDGHTLNAVDPEGNLRWSISADGTPRDARWSASGFRIAYRAGPSLRVVAADGSDDALLDRRVAALPPTWFPLGLHMLAYVNAQGRLRIVNTDTRETLGSAKALAGIDVLEWATNGSMLLEASRRSLRIRATKTSKLANELVIGAPRGIRLPAGATVRDAAFSPNGVTVAALLYLPSSGTRTAQSEVVLMDAASGSLRRLFSVSGRLSNLAWSPQGRRLLVAWRDADQWLFLPVDGSDRVRAIGGISGEFAPGDRGSPSFPQIEGWCCTR